MLREGYLHPTGQMPAYEWNFGDVNPPVHAWATIFLYRMEQVRHGRSDIPFLKRSFHKLLTNFSWWINRKDRLGRNVFEGGFLGLDNIGVFDRSAPLPTGGYLEQADATAWMALFCQNMLEMAVEIAADDPIVRNGGGHVRRSFSRHCERAESARAHRHVGRARRLLLRRAAVAGPPRRTPEGAVGRGSAADLRDDGRRAVAAGARAAAGRALRGAAAAHIRSLARGIHETGEGHFGYGGRGIAGRRQPRPVASDPRAHARRARVPQPVRHSRALARARHPAVRLSACTATSIA